jgi:hypothetical protein
MITLNPDPQIRHGTRKHAIHACLREASEAWMPAFAEHDGVE